MRHIDWHGRDRIDLGTQLVDRQITAPEAESVGKVDDVELTYRDDGTLEVTALLVGASLWAGPVGEARLVAWGRWVVDPLYLTGAFLLLWWSRVNRERRPGALAALVVAADGSLRFLLGTVVSLGLPGGWPSLLPVHAGRLAIALAGAAALWILGGRRAFGPPKLGTGRSWGRWSGWILLYAALLAVALLSNG